MRRGPRLFWYISGGLLLLYSLGALVTGFFNMGIVALLALGLAAAATPYFCGRLAKRGRVLLFALWALAAAAMLFLTTVMLVAAGSAPSAQNPPGTVIVLGAKLVDNQPSLLLRRRLEAALRYLTQNPGASVVVSGGLGEGETITEAVAMRRWLEQNGIASTRIFEEAASTVTSENLLYSAAVIRKNGLDTNIAICTDGFHQLRSAVFARRAGLTPSALCAATPPTLIPMYYVREWFGLVKAFALQT